MWISVLKLCFCGAQRCIAAAFVCQVPLRLFSASKSCLIWIMHVVCTGITGDEFHNKIAAKQDIFVSCFIGTAWSLCQLSRWFVILKRWLTGLVLVELTAKQSTAFFYLFFCNTVLLLWYLKAKIQLTEFTHSFKRSTMTKNQISDCVFLHLFEDYLITSN